MFEEVLNRPSRWRVFWPDVRDRAGANEAIQLAAWVSCAIAGFWAFLTVPAAVAGTGVGVGLLNVALFGGVGLGVHRGWRAAAVGGLIVVAVAIAATVAQGGFPGVLTPFLLVALINGVRGTFAAKRFGATAQ